MTSMPCLIMQYKPYIVELHMHLQRKLIITDLRKYVAIALLALMHSLDQGCGCNSLYFEMNIGAHGCLLSFYTYKTT